jgi:hypothetical protein
MYERQATVPPDPCLRPPEEHEERNAERSGRRQPSGPAEVGADQQRTDEADQCCEQQGSADEVKADTVLARCRQNRQRANNEGNADRAVDEKDGAPAQPAEIGGEKPARRVRSRPRQ